MLNKKNVSEGFAKFSKCWKTFLEKNLFNFSLYALDQGFSTYILLYSSHTCHFLSIDIAAASKTYAACHCANVVRIPEKLSASEPRKWEKTFGVYRAK